MELASLPNETPADDREEFREQFLERVHELLQRGYDELDGAKLNRMRNEEEISGEIGRVIQKSLDENREPWMHQYSLGDQAPVYEPPALGPKRRMGKRRRKLDLRLRRASREHVLRFVWEAKRITDTGSFVDLLKGSGLERFLDGRYAATDDAAGLLGFVQAGGPCEEHAERVRNALETQPTKYEVEGAFRWEAMSWCRGPHCSYRTRHMRGKAGRSIDMYHSFLDCRS